jgi:hypothetical protein
LDRRFGVVGVATATGAKGGACMKATELLSETQNCTLGIFDPIQLKKDQVVKVPVAGHGVLCYRIEDVMRDRQSNTFLRCYQVPWQAEAIALNPRWANLWEDCSELTCLYFDYPTHGIFTTTEPLIPGKVRFVFVDGAFIYRPALKQFLDSYAFVDFVRETVAAEFPGAGDICHRNGVTTLA